MLLGSGELGKEFVIAVKRLGHYVVAVDSYKNAPAMQVADRYEVVNMLDHDSLREVIDFHRPDIVVPEIEAIATEILQEFEDDGMQIVPSARAVNLTMNRDRIRDRAVELGLDTAAFAYATTAEEYKIAVAEIQLPCVVKPVMSSSGKGQTIVRNARDIDAAWTYAIDNMRGIRNKVIVEEFIDFEHEITLLTIKQKNGPTLFCEPIGHFQERGDYQWSWQPFMEDSVLNEDIKVQAQQMAQTITDDLGGAGVFGVEFFIKKTGKDVRVIFSELSPRPHDTGMVTMRSQRYSEFDLHARAILGLPIKDADLAFTSGASAVVLYEGDEMHEPEYCGIDLALDLPGVDVRIFGKPVTRKNRRMGVVLADDIYIAKKAASLITVY
jgi:phosphoribosylglycinamide formyltransferase 2